MNSQDASVVALLVHLVDDIIDEDLEVFHSVIVNNVAHIRYENGLLHPVFQIHQKPKNGFKKTNKQNGIEGRDTCKIYTVHIIGLSLRWSWTRTFLPFTDFHDLLDVGEEEVHVRLTESSD